MATQIHIAGSAWISVSRQLENTSLSPSTSSTSALDGERQWREPPPAAAQPQDGSLDGRVVTLADRAN